jgi:hypothetical protein
VGAGEVGGALVAGPRLDATVVAVVAGGFAVDVAEEVAAGTVVDGAGEAVAEVALPAGSAVEGSGLLQPPARRTNDRITVGVMTTRRVKAAGRNMAWTLRLSRPLRAKQDDC